MLHRLIALLLLSLLLLPTVALAFEPGQEQDEEEFVLYEGAIEPAESADVVREIGDDGAEGAAGAGNAEDGERGVHR